MKDRDPARFKRICEQAGKKSAKSKKHNRWTKAEARQFAQRGGFARHGVLKIKLT